ncbi:MAG: hypothetical protein WCP97_05895 [bacterium]
MTMTRQQNFDGGGKGRVFEAAKQVRDSMGKIGDLARSAIEATTDWARRFGRTREMPNAIALVGNVDNPRDLRAPRDSRTVVSEVLRTTLWKRPIGNGRERDVTPQEIALVRPRTMKTIDQEASRLSDALGERAAILRTFNKGSRKEASELEAAQRRIDQVEARLVRAAAQAAQEMKDPRLPETFDPVAQYQLAKGVERTEVPEPGNMEGRIQAKLVKMFDRGGEMDKYINQDEGTHLGKNLVDTKVDRFMQQFLEKTSFGLIKIKEENRKLKRLSARLGVETRVDADGHITIVSAREGSPIIELARQQVFRDEALYQTREHPDQAGKYTKQIVESTQRADMIGTYMDLQRESVQKHAKAEYMRKGIMLAAGIGVVGVESVVALPYAVAGVEAVTSFIAVHITETALAMVVASGVRLGQVVSNVEHRPHLQREQRQRKQVLGIEASLALLRGDLLTKGDQANADRISAMLDSIANGGGGTDEEERRRQAVVLQGAPVTA